MIVACKQCHKEVNKGVKICPHCGAENPGYQGKSTNYMVYLGYLAIVFAVLYTVADFLGLLGN